MTFSPIANGLEPWGDAVNNGILDVQNQAVNAQATANTGVTNAAAAQAAANAAQTTANAAVPKDAQVIFAKDHGAAGDGVTDDTSALNAILSGMSGGTLLLGNYKYLISGPLILPNNVTLLGAQGLRIQNNADAAPTNGLFLSAGFTGTAAIVMNNNTAGQRIRYLNIDGTAASGTVDGINAAGYVHDVLLDQVHLRKLPHNGLTCTTGSGSMAYSWACTTVVADNCGNLGFSLNSTTDSHFYGCKAIGNGSAGWSINNTSNTHFDSCAAEFSGASGFNVTGAWTTGNGAGGAIFNGCSTDRNVNHGFLVTATGSAPIIINGLMLRRDGSNGTGNGFNVASATCPVIADNVVCYPGVNDDGTGTLSPVTGMSVTSSTYVSVASGFIQAATTPFTTSGSTFRINPNVGLATGSASATIYSLNNPWTTDNGSTFTANLNGNDQTGIKVVQAATFTNNNNALIDLTTGNGTGDFLLKGKVSGDTNSRFAMQSTGQINYGPGNAVADTNLYRSSAGVLKTDFTLSATTGLRLNTTSTAGSVGAFAMANATTAPTSNPTAGIIFYATAGQPTFKDSAGNIVQFTKPTVTGAKGGNAALGSLMTALSGIGLVVDSTTA